MPNPYIVKKEDFKPKFKNPPKQTKKAAPLEYTQEDVASADLYRTTQDERIRKAAQDLEENTNKVIADKKSSDKQFNKVAAMAVEGIKLLDATGITNYPDVAKNWQDGEFKVDDITEALGALPLLGKGKKLIQGAKGATELITTVGKLRRGQKILNRGQFVKNSSEIVAEEFAEGGIVPVQSVEELYPDMLKFVLSQSQIPDYAPQQRQQPISRREGYVPPVQSDTSERVYEDTASTVPTEFTEEEEDEVEESKRKFEEEIDANLAESGDPLFPSLKRRASTRKTKKNQETEIGSNVNMITGTMPGVNAEAGKLKQHFDSKGIPSHISAGIVGNLSAESDFNTGAVNKTSGAFGLAQWLGDRKKSLIKFAKKEGKSLTDPTLQADFIVHELKTTEKEAYNKLLKTKTPQEAAAVFGKHYERPSDEELRGSLGRRVKVANTVANHAFGGEIKDNEMANKKSRKKMAMGGQAAAALGSQLGGNLVNIYQALENSPNAYSEQPLINMKQGSMEMNPMSRGFRYANGGTVPVEVEGGEVAETPDGTMLDFKGPKHENGGIDVNLPGGTKVYSDRLTIDGKSMEERKRARQKSLDKLQKSLAGNPNDTINKQALKRMALLNEIEDSNDMAIQEAARNIYAPPSQKMATGGILGDDFNYMDYQNRVLGWGNQEFSPLPTASAVIPMSAPAQLQPVQVPSFGGSAQVQSNPASDYTDSTNTLGNAIGIAGSAFGAIAPLMTTRAMAENQRPNENFYRNFGKDALEANSTAMQYVDRIRGNADVDMRTKMNAAKAGNRNSARSIQALRALDRLTDMATNQASNDIYGSYAGQMMGLLGQRAGLENQQDQFVMSGEHQADIANRQDQGAFYSNLGRDLQSIATGTQNLGKQMNQIQENDDTFTLLNELGQYVQVRKNRRTGKLEVVNK